jgi:hypothetical protein
MLFAVKYFFGCHGQDRRALDQTEVNGYGLLVVNRDESKQTETLGLAVLRFETRQRDNGTNAGLRQMEC